ncbi:hypothetical protein GCM10011613_21800 [Cellvibrio zantedeschiae]|uniref:Beta-lactamase-related domain-containing protein n=2 Tax=Cellvibrio zantedeschiae TaxID=1237077 RepID=A0ABQ3B3Q0_9GAMM|nr:hypothetical protein GCM10011613_21800 [Cellvibrio zantedeschiae]
MADIPSGVAIASNTGFRLASVSKPFTAIAIMQLVERGELKLSDSVLDYIPELSPSWKKINIEHLLTHSSGIFDIFNDEWRPSFLNGLTQRSLIKYLSNHSDLEFEPGTRYDYSNTGYILLASIIERKTGLGFPEYMQQNIFGPANMQGSYINDESQAIKYGDALNYARLRTYYGIVTYLKGSMAQVSSRDDFFHFFNAMRENKLVSAETLQKMWSPSAVGNYGYGFYMTRNHAVHSGLWDGFQTDLSITKSQDVAYIILTNSGSVGGAHITAIKSIISTTPF